MRGGTFFSLRMAWLFAALSCLSLVLLCSFIRGVIGLVRRSHILSVPLRGEQEIVFNEAGRVVLCIEGPRFTRRFARHHYELSTTDGTVVSGRPTLLRARTSGFSTVRLELKCYVIPRPGNYMLRIQGLGDEQKTDPREQIVFMRPHLVRTIGFILGIVLAAGGFITGLVFFLLSFVP
ncbi:MAG TPA: hypothetical protein PLI53_03975 [Geobacteraceae bacterium]|nr:hypothetical protein [Geobacteraceae bacterium]